MTGGCNLHTHSRYSDGTASLTELVEAALAKGFTALGFSDHSWAPEGDDIAVHTDQIQAYLEEIAALKQTYSGKIELYAGLEVDSFDAFPKERLDFTIGSVHYLHDPERDIYYSIDYTVEQLIGARDQLCGGDMHRVVEAYYESLLDFLNRYRPDIAGHVDLIKKLNAGNRFFDEHSQWYRQLVEKTARALARTGCIIEVNTSGMRRGEHQDPYPSEAFLRIFCRENTPILLSSDAHKPEDLDYRFEEAAAWLRDIGFRSTMGMIEGKFKAVAI